MKKRIQNLIVLIWMIVALLFAGCSEAGEVSYVQEAEISQETGISQETAVDSTDALNQYVVEDTLSRNCYQAFHGYVSNLPTTEWTGFRLTDFDGDKTDELIATKKDRESIKQDELRYFVMDWEDRKITVTEMDSLTEDPSGKPFYELEYYEKDFILPILIAEEKNYVEGVTKEEKDFFYLVAGIAWAEEGWADETPERRNAIEDYLVVSELGEMVENNAQFQYRMLTADVIEFYKDVCGWEREYSPDHDSSQEIGVRNESNGYLYGHNGIGWGDYAVITKVEREESELKVHATVKSVYTDNHLAEVTVFLEATDGKYGYALQGYEVVRDTDFDSESGLKMEEFQAENIWIQYVSRENPYSGGSAPVIKDLRFMENDEEMFTALAKQLLTQLKIEYQYKPGSDGSNVAAKSFLLASYDFTENSKILIYEDAVYGKVPAETGDGSEYGYYVNYCVLTPGDHVTYGEIFRYNESFGDMPADRKGISHCRHYFLGYDWSGAPVIDTFAYVPQTADFAKEIMFYAEVGRSHDMTIDEEGWERYDEDFYVYGAYFRPDGTRIINQFDTWQVATWEYVSNGAFIKDPKDKTLFEQRVGTENGGFYVEGKKLTLEKKPEDTVEKICDVTLDATTKLIGQIYYREWENLINVDLVFYVDGTEVHHNLWSYVTFW